ncbi:MAG: hypothetical protein KC978_23465 [Candidatus Omnitrophica bacterium]|nr:hypothetical protein [Candidatus Omnitrophota bacterium]
MRMTKIDKAYWDGINRMTLEEKANRAFAIYQECHNMHQAIVREQEPGLSQREVNRRVAMRMYQSDPVTQRLLREAAPK